MLKRNHSHNKKSSLLPILVGLFSLALSPLTISYSSGEVEIHLPWTIILPAVISLAYGVRGALLVGVFGGMFYPFVLWTNNGWANVQSSLLVFVFLMFLGYTADYRKRLYTVIPISFVILSLFVSYCLLFSFGYFVTFEKLLSFNPPFWTDNVITQIDTEILVKFVVKDLINFTFISLLADTLLRLPPIRRVLKIGVSSKMRRNTQVFTAILFSSVLIWLTFYLLDYLLSDGKTVFTHNYLSLSLFVTVMSSGIVGRFVIGNLESKLLTEEALQETEKSELEVRHEMEIKEVELQQQALHMVNLKNNLSDLENDLKSVRYKQNLDSKDIQKILSGITVNKSVENEWDKFEQYFNKVHPDFANTLISNFEKLSLRERRLAALIKMDLGSREMAALFNVEHRSIIMYRFRLKKKLGLGDDDDLTRFIQTKI